MPEGALRALRAAAGEDALELHPPVELDGVKIGATLRPQGAPALAAALRALGEQGLAAVVRGGGSRLGIGNAPRRADVLLSTERLAGIDVLDGDEGVAHVRAGTPVAELREAARELGWQPALDAPGPRATVGGVLAAAAVGPRSAALGLPRDVVLGLEVALASGERTRCGSRVVKNVTGYDLQKLYTGSLGTLGVIERAWLRLRPRPEREATLAAPAGVLAGAVPRGVGEARSAAARAVALLCARSARRAGLGGALRQGELLLVAELAGAAPLVDREERRLRDALGAEPADPGAVDRIREAQGAMPGPGGLRLRVSATASKLAAAAGALERAGAELIVYPGLGLVFAGFDAAAAGPAGSPEADPGAPGRSDGERACDTGTGRAGGRASGDGASGGAVPAALAAGRRAARAGRGDCRVEAAPARVKRTIDVFGDAGATLPLLRALKQQFDPAGVLSPGRFVGGI